MRLSYVIISYNRRDTLLKTLSLLPGLTPLDRRDYEIWVVDNASTDGSAHAVAAKFPKVKLIQNKTNQGMYARNHAFAHCAGDYIISLDDDSFPVDQRDVSMILSHMDANPLAGALVGRVILPDGSFEGPALPTICMGGASCFRRSVLTEVGGFRKEFFRQAEEYDLSFRIWRAGYRIERREDIVFRHDKVSGQGRASSLVQQMDLRNNLIIAQRFLPRKLRSIYWHDWRQRYSAIAQSGENKKTNKRIIRRALAGAWMWRVREAFTGRQTLSPDTIEHVFGFQDQANAVGEWARKQSVWRVVLGDFGKNIWATYNACRASGLQLRCIADENRAFDGIEYRGLPVVSARRAFEGGGIDGVVLSNTNPAQIEARAKSIRQFFAGPILKLWAPSRFATQTRAVAAQSRAQAA